MTVIILFNECPFLFQRIKDFYLTTNPIPNFEMKSCYICGLTGDSFHFPSDISESQAWSTILGCPLPNKIGFGGEKLCQSHFNDYDIYTNSRGARRLKKGAKPLKMFDQETDKDDTVYLVSKEHIKIGANKSLLASSSKYLKAILSSSYYQIVDTTLYFQDTSHYIIKCFLEVLYCFGEVMMIDSKYKSDMIEFLKLIKCDVLLVEEDDEEEDDDDEEDDEEEGEEENDDEEEVEEEEDNEDDDDNNNTNGGNDLETEDASIMVPSPASIITGPPRKKQKLSYRDNNLMSEPVRVIKTYKTMFKPRM